MHYAAYGSREGAEHIEAVVSSTRGINTMLITRGGRKLPRSRSPMGMMRISNAVAEGFQFMNPTPSSPLRCAIATFRGCSIFLHLYGGSGTRI